MPKKIDLIGLKFERLLVLEEIPERKYKQIFWKCKCDCGKIVNISGAGLRNGTSKSCGCFYLEKITKHGRKKSKEYGAYRQMHMRCYNPNARIFEKYGKRGIKICERWKSEMNENNKLILNPEKFDNFINDMNERPEKMTLDRINNNDDYKPENCRWADHTTQVRNRSDSVWRFVFGIKFESSTHAAEIHKVSESTIRNWCDGYYRKGKFISPKENCWSEKKYK